MPIDFPQMLLPLLVATALLLSSPLIYGVALRLMVRVAKRIHRNRSELGFSKNTAVMAIVMLITAAAHLTQIVLWAAAFVLCGQIRTWETAFYFSMQNYTALGYGDIQLSDQWRLLGPLEAVHGLLAFGLSTALLFAILSRLIANQVRNEDTINEQRLRASNASAACGRSHELQTGR